MSIGAGIAIAGAWAFAASCALSSTVNGRGFRYGIAAAAIVTVWVMVLYR
jgi:hypothetical protein